MTVLLIANNSTIESGSFMGDALCLLKTCYLFVENTPNVSHVIMSVSPENKLHFLWQKFIDKYNIELIYDNWNPGDWSSRFEAWDKWRNERTIEGRPFDVMKECYLRIHGALRQTILCGSERGLGRRNIYSYWYCGQENCPDELPVEVDHFDDSLIYHPALTHERDVYISPHCKTQGNYVFTFDYWGQVIRHLLNANISVTVGYDGYFFPEFDRETNFKRHWGDHKQWMEQVCSHKLVACGNTGTGWLAAACGTPMITMEPHNSVMRDHRYRECGLRNLVEVIDGNKLDELDNDMAKVAEYCAKRIIQEVRRCLVMTTGCYDVLHAGHVRHLERARAMGTKLVVALNSDSSVSFLKGEQRPINPQEQRKTVLEALRCVDEVRIFDGPDALHLIEELKPDVLACGYGYTVNNVVGKQLVESYGGKVVVTCQGDGRSEPSTTKIVKKLRSVEINEIVQLGALHSVNPPEKLRAMADELLKVVHLEGDVADLGSYKGGSALILRRLAPDKDLHIIDTWEGNPYDDPLCHHGKGEWAVSLKECKAVVGESLLTYYCKGVFPYCTDDNLDMKFCFVYCDMDVYQSTKDAIRFFWPRMVGGGVMLFDDWLWPACRGVEKAVREIFTDDQIRSIPNLHTCIVEKK